MLAHSANAQGEAQSLVSHLTETARLASEFAREFDAGGLGYLAGLWHDVGKFSDAFQQYLLQPEGKRGPDHKSAGAVHAAEAGNDIVAWTIAGHHGGLPSRTELESRLQQGQPSSDVRRVISAARSALSQLGSHPPPAAVLPRFLAEPEAAVDEDQLKWMTELFIRVLFSALVDADFLDTERHFSRGEGPLRGGAPSLASLWEPLEQSQQALSGRKDDILNRARHDVYLRCLQEAERAQGFFRLTVPTGGGKTRSAMAFALKHALTHGLRRVIVAVPYTSITEQTADTYRDIFADVGDHAVLEHHSEATWWADDDDSATSQHTWSRLASENWDAPVIVTTTVQLLESLFSNRPGRCRKLHNIAGSVVVLDEVQTLPTGLLKPILDVLRELVAHYRVSVVLCSATLPAFQEEVGSFALEGVREIVPNAESLFRALRRVAYDLSGLATPWSWQRVAHEMNSAERCMAVVNTKSNALSLLEALDDPDVLHLSTLLCGAHRRRVLSEIRRRLQAGEACRLVSTQVVEAGVDLDFPLVLRAMGPLDRIVQAAGRCNREGLLSGMGHVVVFCPEAGGLPPGEYRTATSITEAILTSAAADMFDPGLYRQYFGRLFGARNLDEKGVQEKRKGLDFPEVARRFRLIDDDTVPVVVRYGPERDRVDALVEALRRESEDARGVRRQLQPYVVNVRRRKLDEMQRDGLLIELRPEFYMWGGEYDDLRGLVGLAVEDLVF